MIDTSKITETLDWLSTRMNKYEKQQLLLDLNLKTVNELITDWDLPEVRERINQEVRKRLTVKDNIFKLDIPKNKQQSYKPKYIPKTFVDMTSKDD